jgi:predicted nucleic acid-binding protein
VNETWVVNASPLIALGRVGQLELLGRLCDRVLIPDRVIAEVARGKRKDPSAPATLQWAERFATRDVDVLDFVAGWDLGAGESQVISLCHRVEGMRAVLDDGEARRCAATLAIPMIGTLGVLLQAKKRGFILEARPVAESLLRNGLYFDQSLMDQALAACGE